jgi:hypothetical protein
MKPQNTQVLSITTCRHRTRTGRRCRFPVSENSALCFRHATRLDAKLVDADLSAAFGNEPLDFRSAVQINDFLAKLSGLLIQNRISSRRASVLAYIANLELRTLPAIDHELNPHDEFPRIIFGPPDPPYSQPSLDDRNALPESTPVLQPS